MNTQNEPWHISKMKQILLSRKQRNARYSLRSFARDIEVSPATLSSVLNQKQGLSRNKAAQICSLLCLSKEESRLFILSVLQNDGRSSQIRDRASSELRELEFVRQNRAQLTEAALQRVQSWTHMGLLELLEVEGCDHTVSWFADRLGISPQETERILQDLTTAELLRYDGQVYRAVTLESQSTSDVPSQAIRRYHLSLLKKAETALETEPLQQREFSSLTFSFPSERVEEAKETLREFIEQFARKFYSPDQKKDSVYQLSLQFFRLDKRI